MSSQSVSTWSTTHPEPLCVHFRAIQAGVERPYRAFHRCHWPGELPAGCGETQDPLTPSAIGAVFPEYHFKSHLCLDSL